MRFVLLSEQEYWALARRRDTFLSQFRSLREYEAWKEGLASLKVFWTGEGRVALVGVKDEGELQLAARLLVVPFYERRRWGVKGAKLRGGSPGRIL